MISIFFPTESLSLTCLSMFYYGTALAYTTNDAEMIAKSFCMMFSQRSRGSQPPPIHALTYRHGTRKEPLSSKSGSNGPILYSSHQGSFVVVISTTSVKVTSVLSGLVDCSLSVPSFSSSFSFLFLRQPISYGSSVFSPSPPSQ